MPKTDPDISVNQQRVWLAVVGKHPGWNDHLDDIGLDTERLVGIKRHLYVEGIGGIINAGTWEALPDSERDEGFAHTFFWRQPDGMVIGRMWSSSDGKGRKKYPMIACAMCRGLPFSFVAGPLMERLRRLEETCREVSTAAEVISAADRVRAEITELASFVPELTDTSVAGDGRPGSAAALIESGTVGEDGVGLQRVLYQVEREMGAFIRPEGAETASRSRSVEVRGQQIRVPSPAGANESGHEHESIGLWCRLLLGKIDPLVPMFFAVKDGRRWVDVIVGELGPTPLTCLQGGTESHPLTSDIPFTIEGEIAERYNRSIEASKRGETGEKDPCFVDVPQDRLAPFLRPRRGERSAKADEGGQRRLLIIAGVVVVVVVLAVILGGVFGGGGDDGTPDREQDTTAAQRDPEPRDPAPRSETARASEESAREADATVVAEEENGRERFLAWCEVYGSFYGPFIGSLDREAAFRDPSLASVLGPPLDAAEGAGEAIDPLASTPGRFRSLSALMENPPSEVFASDFAAVIEDGFGTIDAVRKALGDGWETRSRLGEIRSRAPPGEVPQEIETWLSDLGSIDGAAVASAVAAISGHAGEIGSAWEALSRFDGAAREFELVSNSDVAGLYSAVDPASGIENSDATTWLAALAARAESWASAGERAAGAASAGLARVDPGLLSARMAQVGHPRTQTETIRFIEAWADAVSDPGLYLLDPDTDPRRRLAALPSVQDLRSSLSALVEQSENAETRELAGMLEAFEASSNSLTGVPWNEATRDRVTGETDDLVSLAGVIAERIDAERRTRAVQAERYVAELRSTPSVTQTGSDAIDAAWVDARDRAIATFENNGDVVTLSRSIDGARQRLDELERGMPVVRVNAGSFGELTEAVAAAAAEHRESLVASAIAGGQATADEYSAWRASLERGERSFALLSQSMSRWAIDREDGEDESPVALAETWLACWPRRIVASATAATPVDTYARALTTSDAALLGRILGDEEQAAAVLRAAWSRINAVDPTRTGSAEAFRTDLEVATRLLAEASAGDDIDRERVETSVRSIAADRWIAAASESEQDGFSGFVSAADRLGLDTRTFPTGLRFNCFVVGLRDRVADGDALDRESLLEELRAARAWLADRPAALAWASAFADELSAREGREIDYRVIGPARAGWAVEPFDSGRRLVYTWTRGDEARRLAFRLVETPETGAFYLAETESALWLMTEIALAGEARDAVLATLPADWNPLPDTRLGPRVWTWAAFRGDRVIRRARTWVVRNDTPDRPFYPDGMEGRVGRPSDEHPIQRVSARAAATIAATVGCRLPTVAEWRAAAMDLGSVAPSDSMNLRDEMFDTRRAHTVSLGSGISVVWGEQQSFADGTAGIPGGSSAESYSGSDGTLWFVGVGEGGDRTMRHLIGNVAEFVLPDLESAGELGDRGGEVAVVTRAVSSEAPGAVIIGASALSPPSLAPDQPVEPAFDPGELGFTDVGFRLAFSPGVEAPLVVVVGEMLRGAPFLRNHD